MRVGIMLVRARGWRWRWMLMESWRVQEKTGGVRRARDFEALSVCSRAVTISMLIEMNAGYRECFVLVCRRGNIFVVGILGRRRSGREGSKCRSANRGQKESQQERVDAGEILRRRRRKGVECGCKLTTLHRQVGRGSKSHYNA